MDKSFNGPHKKFLGPKMDLAHDKYEAEPSMFDQSGLPNFNE